MCQKNPTPFERDQRLTGVRANMQRQQCVDAVCDGGIMRSVMDRLLHPVHIEGLRRMSPAQKLRMVADLYEAGIQLRVAGLRRKCLEQG